MWNPIHSWNQIVRFSASRGRKRHGGKKTGLSLTRRNRGLTLESLEERQLLTVSPLPDTGPIALLFPSINISQGTTATVIPLVNEFREPGVSPSAFQYQVVADSNPSLFAAAPLLVSSQQLLLRVTPDALGSTELTVRATDPNGHSADATIVVNVSGSSTGQASGTANGRSSRSVGVAQDENGGSTKSPRCWDLVPPSPRWWEMGAAVTAGMVRQPSTLN